MTVDAMDVEFRNQNFLKKQNATAKSPALLAGNANGEESTIVVVLFCS